MLFQLNVKNFALIDNLSMEFTPGFNVLTGETGAGKSIIIDAVALLLGARASSEIIRVNQEKAIIEGTFYISKNHATYQLLWEAGFDLEEDEGMLILTREISLNGKNICRINNRIVTLTFYKLISSTLINIYGQHDYHSLSQAEKHLQLLDSLGDKKFQKLLQQVADNYTVYKSLQSELESITNQLKNKEQRSDFLKFQIKEIVDLNLQENEDEEIQQELELLNNWEKVFKAINQGHELLYGSNSAYDKIGQVINELEDIAYLDQKFADIIGILQGVNINLAETAHSLKAYNEGFEFDPHQRDYLQERKFAIDKLKRKYGGTIKDIQDFLKDAQEELDHLEKSDIKLNELEEKLKASEEKFVFSAKQLSQERKKIATRFIRDMQGELKELAMVNTKFEVKFTQKDYSPQGIDAIEFLISPNPGEPLRPLAKIASGGEMSRIMLAFKVILAGKDANTSLIFDEIDAGIGGEVLLRVADKLFQVSKYQQVLCVTHSPHIANYAQRHFRISKLIKNNKTSTKVQILSEEEIIKELARMLGGQEEITVNHALEMRKKLKSINK